MTTTTSKTSKSFRPYGRQHVTAEDIAAVTAVLESDWLTQGPAVERFETRLRQVTEANHAVSCASGTAALHLLMLALKLGPGDRILTTANTFLADANCAHYVGADVVFADVDPTTGLMSLDDVEHLLSIDNDHTIKAIIAVQFAGQPLDMVRLRQIADSHGAILIEDACHALGGSYRVGTEWHRCGSCSHAHASVFSFHPVKHAAAGEGGAITTNDHALAEQLAVLRSHGIERTSFVFDDQAFDTSGRPNPWYYEMSMLGFNYRLSDIHAALGTSQLARLEWSVTTRNNLAQTYEQAIAALLPDVIQPLHTRSDVINAYHLFVVRIPFGKLGVQRAEVMRTLRERGIGTQVHYIPIPCQPYYREMGIQPDDYSGALDYYHQALSLPMYPTLPDDEIARIIGELVSALRISR